MCKATSYLAALERFGSKKRTTLATSPPLRFVDYFRKQKFSRTLVVRYGEKRRKRPKRVSSIVLSHFPDSNRGPTHYECVALPTEPKWRRVRQQVCNSRYRFAKSTGNLCLRSSVHKHSAGLCPEGTMRGAEFSKSGCKSTAFF